MPIMPIAIERVPVPSLMEPMLPPVRLRTEPYTVNSGRLYEALAAERIESSVIGTFPFGGIQNAAQS